MLPVSLKHALKEEEEKRREERREREHGKGEHITQPQEREVDMHNITTTRWRQVEGTNALYCHK